MQSQCTLRCFTARSILYSNLSCYLPGVLNSITTISNQYSIPTDLYLELFFELSITYVSCSYFKMFFELLNVHKACCSLSCLCNVSLPWTTFWAVYCCPTLNCFLSCLSQVFCYLELCIELSITYITCLYNVFFHWTAPWMSIVVLTLNCSLSCLCKLSLR